MSNPVIGIIMGADKDLEVMAEAAKALEELEVPYEMRIVSAHRTPEAISNYTKSAEEKGIKVIIAGAGGSAHLPGMTASHTLLPVLAVPVKPPNHDHEALWSNIKMPTGIALATMPENGARNAALLAVEILSLSDNGLRKRYAAWRKKLHDDVMKTNQELQAKGWPKYLDDMKK